MKYKIGCWKGKSYDNYFEFYRFLCILESYGYDVRHKMAKTKSSVDLRQKIIDTAWKLFYKNGYENTTVNDIIREVGTSKEVDFIII